MPCSSFKIFLPFFKIFISRQVHNLSYFVLSNSLKLIKMGETFLINLSLWYNPNPENIFLLSLKLAEEALALVSKITCSWTSLNILCPPQLLYKCDWANGILMWEVIWYTWNNCYFLPSDFQGLYFTTLIYLYQHSNINLKIVPA